MPRQARLDAAGVVHHVIIRIYLNPLRAGLVATVGEMTQYKYSGHSALLGRRKCEWQDVGYVLSYFGKKAGDARKRYAPYVRKEVYSRGRRTLQAEARSLFCYWGWGVMRELGYKLDGGGKAV